MPLNRPVLSASDTDHQRLDRRGRTLSDTSAGREISSRPADWELAHFNDGGRHTKQLAPVTRTLTFHALQSSGISSSSVVWLSGARSAIT